MPVISSTPNSTPMNSSGAAIHWVSPSDSGPPIAKPMKPAACWRPAGVPGDPAHRCHRPSAGRATIAAPRISRGRASGSGSVRISTTAIAMSATGNTRTADPISTRKKLSIHPPTGLAASNHELAMTTTAMPSSASAIPSRRWPGWMSRARPTDRAVEPAPLASMNQPARAPRPMASPAAGMGDGLGRLACFRRGAGLTERDPDREPAFDLVERAPERAAVLLGMVASLVAGAPYAPSATRVTVMCRNLVRFTE